MGENAWFAKLACGCYFFVYGWTPIADVHALPCRQGHGDQRVVQVR
jgi:hypothetical protein